MKKLTKYQKAGIGTAAALFVTLIVAVIAMFAGKGTESYRSIKIVETSGQVTIGRNGIGELDAAVNMNLISGDYVHTGQGAYVVLMLDADKYVMLGETGSMQVVAEGDKTRGRTSIRLEQGSALSEIQNPLGQGESYEVVTPNATMSVRGTVFEIDRDENGEVSLLVFDGTVALGLDGQEPVLYNAGEYMQFKEGNPPQIIVDREPISEEVMNEQMRQRLKEISESGKKLEMGTVQLGENDTPPDETGTPEPEKTSGSVTTQEPVTTPEPETTPEPTETPAPTPTPKPTPKPTPAPTPEPTPEATPEPAQQPGWTWQPTPTPTPGYYVTFAKPCVYVDGTAIEKLTDVTEKNSVYESRWVEQGKTLTAPTGDWYSPLTSDGSSPSLKLEGWYLENGTKWDFDTGAVNSNLTLYPVWEEVMADVSGSDDGGTAATKYWPVIFKEAGRNGECVYVCLPENTSDMPAKDLNNNIIGWRKTADSTASDQFWDPEKDKVEKVTVLWAAEPAYTVTFVKPYIWTQMDLLDLSKVEGKSDTYVLGVMEAGKTVTEPEKSQVLPRVSLEDNETAFSEFVKNLEAIEWQYLEEDEKNGIKWCRWDINTDLVNSNITLYPVWKADEETRYYPVIFRGALSGNAAEESVCVCLVGNPNLSISMPNLGLDGQKVINGWTKTKGSADSDQVWNSGTVDGPMVLWTLETPQPSTPPDSTE